MSVTAIAMAASPPEEPVAKTDVEILADLLAQTTAMQARFEHVMRDIDGEVVDESGGNMAWLKPDKFRWDIVQPVEQSIVVDGDTYYQFDSDLDQLIIETVTAEITGLTSILLGGDAQAIGADYKVQQIIAVAANVSAGDVKANAAINEKANSNPFTAQSFKLTPLRDDAVFVSILLQFSGSFLQVLAVEDDLNNISRFEFFRDDSGVAVSDATFELQTSETTEVIRQ